ncbi:MAG: MATE family efflux transporter [Muribaculaceae bacterium]|nr:MATE family efflux transporter [Muribaculaceae bacterium]
MAKNSVYLSLRMLLVMGVSLYTARVVIDVLGVEDYGVYAVVGGVVGLLSFFTSSLTNATQRFFSVGLGRNDIQETNRYFNQSILLYALICLMILAVGETIGLWFVENKLVIPEGREIDAFWTFQFSLLSVIINIMATPYVSDVIAREKMSFYASLGIFEVVLKLGLTFALLYFKSIGSAALYALFIALSHLIIFVIYVVYCRGNFGECVLRFYWNLRLVKDMIKFISSNLFGCFAYSVGMQGNDVLLNLFFGPVVNAARGITMQVNNAVFKFSDGILSAVKPQIIKSYNSGNTDHSIWLIFKSSVYSYLLILIIGAILFLNIDLILRIWLPDVPEYTAIFTRLILIDSQVGILIAPFWLAANATGKILRNQVYGRVFILLSLPISFLVLKIWANPIVPFVVNIAAQAAYLAYSLWDIHDQMHFGYKSYFKDVISPILIISIITIFIGVIEKVCITSEWVLLFVSIATLPVVILSLTYKMTLTSEEKLKVREIIRLHTNKDSR